MSSSPPTESPPTDQHRAAHRARLRGWSLRAKLVATVLGLLTLICVVFGVTTQLALRQFLLNQTDNRLTTALGPGPRGNQGDNQGRPQNSWCGIGTSILPPGQNGALRAQFAADQTVVAQRSDANGCAVALPTSLYATLRAVPVDGGARTRSLGSLGDYRLVAQRTSEGTVVVTGLSLSDMEDTLNTLALTEISVALGGLLLAGSTGTVLIRRELRPLRRVAATASRVSELPLEKGEVALSVRVPTVDTDARTEVGQVGSALNRMLGHVGSALKVRQASETRMRQFLADASHELRTPLAAIRGYAELSRRMDADVPPDVAHAMRRVESEARRMTTLVEDLLLLARLDAGRPLDRTPVDLSGLVVDCVSDAHAAGPDHHWQLDLPDEPVVVTGDPLRLHQVLANLLANAGTHTPPGTRVTVGLAADRDRARLTVADNGPGIPPDLLPEVFNRFARADTSRSRAAGSTGLGLAIVAAVVETHFGTVEVASQPGHTVFTVTLPLAAHS
jgi:two-component system OmpR family sensor kinase